MRLTMVAVLILTTTGMSMAVAEKGETVAEDQGTRAQRLVEVCTQGTHAFQVKLQQKSGKGDAQAFSPMAPDDGGMDFFIAQQGKILRCDVQAVRDWVEGKPSSFDASAVIEATLNSSVLLDQRLPVMVARRVFAQEAPEAKAHEIAALANLLQIALEIDRDGDILQDQLRLYTALGWKVAPGDFGLKDDDATFLELGKELSQASCPSPYETSPEAWQIALRKIQNWALKHRGEISPKTYAAEIMERDAVKKLLPGLKKMPAQKILVVGHSYTMDAHWSSGGSFIGVVRELFSSVNPKVTVKQVGVGGMTASTARQRFLDQALSYKADRVFIVTVLGNDKDFAALEEMGTALRKNGAEVIVFERLHPVAGSWINANPAKLKTSATRAGITVVATETEMTTHPQRPEFVSLDGVHMTGTYHKWMAEMLLRYLVSN